MTIQLITLLPEGCDGWSNEKYPIRGKQKW